MKALGGSSGAPKEQLSLVKVMLVSQFDSVKHEIEALEVPFICDHLIEPPPSHLLVQKLVAQNKVIADIVSLPGLQTEIGLSLLIGADQIWKLVLNEVCSQEEVAGLTAINTKLGWTLQRPARSMRWVHFSRKPTRTCLYFT